MIILKFQTIVPVFILVLVELHAKGKRSNDFHIWIKFFSVDCDLASLENEFYLSEYAEIQAIKFCCQCVAERWFIFKSLEQKEEEKVLNSMKHFPFVFLSRGYFCSECIEFEKKQYYVRWNTIWNTKCSVYNYGWRNSSECRGNHF